MLEAILGKLVEDVRKHGDLDLTENPAHIVYGFSLNSSASHL
jgi:hypothetical protein